MMSILQNILLGLTLAAPIGPLSIEMIKRGLKYGWKGTFITGLGAVLADAILLTIIFFGITWFIDIPAMKIILWLFGMLVLLYFGILSIKESRRKIKIDEKSKYRGSFYAGFIIAISNPLGFVFWIGVFGSILAQYGSEAGRLQTLLLSFTIFIGVLLWDVVLSFATHWGSKVVNQKIMHYVNLIAGIILIGFSLYFGYQLVLLLMEIFIQF